MTLKKQQKFQTNRNPNDWFVAQREAQRRIESANDPTGPFGDAPADDGCAAEDTLYRVVCSGSSVGTGIGTFGSTPDQTSDVDYLSAVINWDRAGLEATDWWNIGSSTPLPFDPQTVTILTRYQDIDSGEGDRSFVEFWLSGTGFITTSYIIILPANSSNLWNLYHNGGDDIVNGFAELDVSAIDVTDWFWLKVESASEYIRAKIWQDGDSEPVGWGATASSPGNPEGINGTFFRGFVNNWSIDAVDGTWLWQFSEVDITGYDDPTDVFDRTVSNGWGTSTDGAEWTLENANPPTDAVIEVAGAAGDGQSCIIVDDQNNTVGTIDSEGVITSDGLNMECPIFLVYTTDEAPYTLPTDADYVIDVWVDSLHAIPFTQWVMDDARTISLMEPVLDGTQVRISFVTEVV